LPWQQKPATKSSLCCRSHFSSCATINKPLTTVDDWLNARVIVEFEIYACRIRRSATLANDEITVSST
jgi:hypothetical protein